MFIWIAAVLGVSCCGQALDTWKMIPAKSRNSTGHLAKAITATYEARSGAEIWTFYQLGPNGISETTSQTVRFDGKEYSCGDLGLEERPDTVVSRKLDAQTAEVSYKKSGRVTRRVLRTFSADGKQMRLDIHITAEKGPAVEQWLVFER
jgi:hypothetical protein